MEKPTTMPLKEFLIKKLSLELMIPEFVVKEIVNFQITESFRATVDRNSIELSGFGKLVFNYKKALKRLYKYKTAHEFYIKELEQDITPERRVNLNKRMITLKRDMEFLKSKLRDYESKTDI